jgi:NADPH:quinone reductase-like Zn-dependent oxidoreductase
MKAMVMRRYGPPDVLRLEEVPKPAPKENEVLVRVHAASLNAVDWHFLRGKPILVRLKFGLITPKNRILGYDIAGRVEQIGSAVTRLRPGDDVLAGMGFGLGGFAEYACVAEDGFVGPKPQNLSFEQAAAVPGAGSSPGRGC